MQIVIDINENDYKTLMINGGNCSISMAERIVDSVFKGKKLPNSMWIPVSERLPKGSEIVLLSLPPRIEPNGEECSASVICGHYIGGKNAEWGLSDGETFGYGIVSVRKGINPIAWMPLPEPYKEEKEDTL